MNTTATATATKTAHAIIKPVILPTHWADIVVWGSELVGAKMMHLLHIILTRLEDFIPTEGDHGVRSVFFRIDEYPITPADDKGDPIIACCCPANNGIIINVRKTLSAAIEATINNNELSIVATYWVEMLKNILHETHHAHILSNTPTGIIEKELETMAEKWATEKLYKMAQLMDIEPDHYQSIPALADIKELLDDSEWGAKQKMMLETGLMYVKEPKGNDNGLQLWSFKQFCHMLSGDPPASEKWAGALNKAMAPVPPVKAEVTPPVEVVITKTTITPDIWEELCEAAATEGRPEPACPFVYDNVFDAAAAEALEMDCLSDEAVEGTWSYGPEPTQPAAPAQYTPAAPVQYTPAAPAATTPCPQFPAACPQFPVGNVVPQPQLPPMIIPSEKLAEIVNGLYMKVFNHIFMNCGRLVNSDLAFTNPEAVGAMPITLTEDERQIVIGCDCIDEMGRWQKNVPTTNGLVRGQVTKEKKLPNYKLYIRTPTGIQVRLLMAQNPAKVHYTTKQYTKPAQRARDGHCIMWISESNETTQNGRNTLLFKIEDGVLTRCGTEE